MSDQSQPQGNSAPSNAVLRGGPYDGRTVAANLQQTLAYGEHGMAHTVYRPTGEADDEYPTLMRFVLDQSEPA